MLTGNAPSRTLRPSISNAPPRAGVAPIERQIVREIVAVVFGLEADQIVVDRGCRRSATWCGRVCRMSGGAQGVCRKNPIGLRWPRARSSRPSSIR